MIDIKLRADERSRQAEDQKHHDQLRHESQGHLLHLRQRLQAARWRRRQPSRQARRDRRRSPPSRSTSARGRGRRLPSLNRSARGQRDLAPVGQGRRRAGRGDRDGADDASSRTIRRRDRLPDHALGLRKRTGGEHGAERLVGLHGLADLRDRGELRDHLRRVHRLRWVLMLQLRHQKIEEVVVTKRIGRGDRIGRRCV